jgi:hypothetical protein
MMMMMYYIVFYVLIPVLLLLVVVVVVAVADDYYFIICFTVKSKEVVVPVLIFCFRVCLFCPLRVRWHPANRGPILSVWS